MLIDGQQTKPGPTPPTGNASDLFLRPTLVIVIPPPVQECD